MLYRNKWIFSVAITQHAIWGVTLLFSRAPLGASALHTLSTVLPSPKGIGIVLIGVSSCAFWGLLHPRSSASTLALVPQQLILLITAIGAAICIYHGRFADGVIRPRLFILDDQMPAIIIAFYHTCAILELHAWPLLMNSWRKRRTT